METGVSCGQLVCAAVLPCSIVMDERGEADDVDGGLTGTHVGVGQMMQVGNALQQARVQYYWWIECYSWQYIGERMQTIDTLTSTHDSEYEKYFTHKASQKGMLRCVEAVDASQPLSWPTTTKSVIMLTCGAKVQIDPAFLAEYNTEREKFFSENTQDKHQKRREYFTLVGEDEKTISDDKSSIQGEIMLDGRKTTLPGVTTQWDYDHGKPDKDPCVTSNEAHHMVKLGESAKPCIADWQCTAMLACPFNMCLAPYWLYAMANYMDKQKHTINKTAIAFEKREQTVVHMHSDDIPGLMQDVMNHLTGGATGRYQIAGARGVLTDPGLL